MRRKQRSMRLLSQLKALAVRERLKLANKGSKSHMGISGSAIGTMARSSTKLESSFSHTHSLTSSHLYRAQMKWVSCVNDSILKRSMLEDYAGRNLCDHRLCTRRMTIC